MKVEIYHLLVGARQARGLTVVIDVFRAFSLEAYLFARGAREILAVGSQETAYRLKELHPDYILAGERNGIILPGFDYGNSPSQTKDADIAGKTVVHTTSAGTQGLVGASGADEILTGALVNARAIARYIKERKAEEVSLVAMGWNGKVTAPEDEICARYIKSILEGSDFDMASELAWLRNQKEGAKFFDPTNQAVFPEEDYWMSIDVDRFDFVLSVTQVEPDIFQIQQRG